MASYVNGARWTPNGEISPDLKIGGTVSTLGNTVEVVYNFDYLNLPVESAVDSLVHTIPAGALIRKCYLVVTTAFADGTSIEVGTATPAGVAVDVDGLITPAQGAVANLTAGAVISGRGAQVVDAYAADGLASGDADGVYAAGATGPIANVASQVRVTATGTFTAGAAKLIVEYTTAAVA